jgi:AcrR family transcriptional regulator
MPTTPTRRERRKAETRHRLVAAALASFATRGMTGTRIEDVTEAADVAKGVFYNYFDSKDALVAELVERQVGTLLDDHVAPAVDDSEPPPVRAREVLEAHARYFAQHPESFRLLHQARGLLQLRASENERLRDVFAAYLARVGDAVFGTDRSAPEPARRSAAAAALVGTLSGALSFGIAAGLPAADARRAIELAVAGFAATFGY